MKLVSQPLRIVACSSANALADARVVYTWWTWTFGWLGRMLAQVVFFTFLGSVVVGPQRAAYLVVGNALMISVIETLSVVASSTWERLSGTLTLLAAAPSRTVWVFFGRSIQWPVSGTATSLVAMFVLGPAFGVRWEPAQALWAALLVVLTTVTTYCFGLFLAALVLGPSGLRNVVSSAAYLLMMVVCGVEVPVSREPAVVRVIGDAVPLTHSLAAIRLVLSGAGPAEAVVPACWALAAGACWLAGARFAFISFMNRGRRAGSFDFS
jgi:ABC-2 type transport system permease protein